MVGVCGELGKPSSEEGDGWTGRRTMSLTKCAELIETYGASDHKNTYAYRIAQLSALKTLSLMGKQ